MEREGQKGRREQGEEGEGEEGEWKEGEGNERKGRKEMIIQQATLRVYKAPQHRGNNILIQSYYK